MKVTVLGSGSPEAYAPRASAGHLVEIGDTRILLDCGGGVFDRLLQAGFKPSEIDVICFTHLHSDHMMDYARLIHAAWDEGGAPVHVYGPAPIGAITDKLFGADGVFAHDLAARTEHSASQDVWQARGGTLPRPWPAPIVTEITPGFAHSSGAWRLASCEVPHAQPHLTCMAFALSAGGKKLVYSGDAGMCNALEKLAVGADLLLHWCYRMSDQQDVPAFFKMACPTPPEIAAMAQRTGARRLVLTHMREMNDTAEKQARALAEMKAAFDGPSSIAEDLDVFVL
ncbi:MAG: MBL fold metallo-hydrolase [Pseudomonadota bacterium]